jgi:hypothetical protein
MRHCPKGRREVAFNLNHGRSLALSLAVLAAHVSVAATPGCDGSPFVLQGKLLEHLESEVAASTTAFQGEVIAAEPNPAPTAANIFPLGVFTAPTIEGFDQKLTFRVLHSWKGPYHAGETVSLTLRVVNVCAGVNCVSPFKIGDVTLLFSSSAASGSLEGCWVHEGVVIQSVLSVPNVLMPRSGH